MSYLNDKSKDKGSDNGNKVKSTTSKIQKYRPSLSAPQIAYIVHLAKREFPRSQDSASILKSLVPFLSKINYGAIEVSYTSTPSSDFLEILGMKSLNSLTISKKAYNEGCYVKMQESIESCTPQELDAAQEHAYINDLMSESESKKYEANLETEAEIIRQKL